MELLWFQDYLTNCIQLLIMAHPVFIEIVYSNSRFSSIPSKLCQTALTDFRVFSLTTHHLHSMKRAKQRRRQLPYPLRYSYCKVSGDGAPAWYDPLFGHIILPTNQGPASPPVQPHLGIKQYIILPTNQRPASPPVQPHLWIKQYIFLPTNQRPASQPAGTA